MDEGETVSTLDEVLARALFAVAGELQITMASIPARAFRTGEIGVRESDLQRALCRALQAQLGSVASIEGPLRPAVKEHWSGRLGRADVVAHLDSTEAYFETKLCATDKLYEAVWDLLKLAVLTALPEPAVGYLVYAAPEPGWESKTDRPTASSRMVAPESSSFATATRTPGDGVWTARRRHDRPVCLPMLRPSASAASESAPRTAPGKCAASG